MEGSGRACAFTTEAVYEVENQQRSARHPRGGCRDVDAGERLQTAKADQSLQKLRLDLLQKAKAMPALELNSASAFASTLVIHFTPKITFLFALGILTLSERAPCPAEFRNCLFYIIPLGSAFLTEPLCLPFMLDPSPPQSVKIMQLKPIFFGGKIAQLAALIWLLTVDTQSYRKLLYCVCSPFPADKKKKKMLFTDYLTGQSVRSHSLTCESEAYYFKITCPSCS